MLYRTGRGWGCTATEDTAPGYATAVFVSALSVQRIRTTAESHRRVAIIEVKGRDYGMIALGTAFGQPDIILVRSRRAL
jgi:6-phosphofructokinase